MARLPEKKHPFEKHAQGVSLRVKLTPKAAANRLGGPVGAPDGGVLLKVSVTAVPEGGKANKALIKLLAKTWRLPKTSFSLLSGATARRKTLLIEGEPQMLLTILGDWFARRGAGR